ncbi:TPA: hypothetical protein EYN23_08775, partial [Candidatus Poribacteria bacterium]|nr:hypothetical protein [Candidatus Poribacteria bacterium]
TEVENKVPFLGDIPLIGGLFRSTETIVENSEIVILITPHIVDMQNADDIEKLKQKADEWRHNGSKEVQSESNQDEDPADDEDTGDTDEEK